MHMHARTFSQACPVLWWEALGLERKKSLTVHPLDRFQDLD